MAKNVSQRKPLTGNNRSHALNATKRKQKLNLQQAVINGKKVRISNKEKKSLNK